MNDPTTVSNTRLMRLVEGAAAVAGQTDLTSVLYTTIETAIDLTGAQYGALGVVDEDGRLMEFLHRGMAAAQADEIDHPPEGLGLLGVITTRGEILRLADLSEHPDAAGFPANHPQMRSFLGVPIRLGSEIFGNLYLTDKAPAFTREDEELVAGLAVVAGAAINTARLQRRLRRLAVVEDRERIARDLHDAIIQDLFAVGLSLQAATQKVVSDEVHTVITDTVHRLDEAISALRRFIFDLRPPVWSQRDLREEVSELIGHLTEPYNAHTEIVFEGKLDKLSPNIVDDTLQLISEALSNALRHAGSEQVLVEIGQDRDELMVLVVDQGTGFDLDEPTAGMGLENIRTRAQRAGGEATITTSPGSGTTVRIRLPL
jgi:signal transduction histidine kinase